MTPQSEASFRQWLDDEIADAKASAVETSKGNMNSFGAGFDEGIWRGLLKARSYFTGEDWI